MPVFHFTLHAYRSWNTDNGNGYWKRSDDNRHRTDDPLAAARDSLARHPKVVFMPDECRFLVQQAGGVVARRGWQLYAVSAIESHLHIIVGWSSNSVSEDEVQTQLKRSFGFLLAQRRQTKGVPYFSRGGSPERVRGEKHLNFLMTEYLPSHHGPMWARTIIKK